MQDIGVFYPQVKLLHLWAVSLSLALFTARWLGVLLCAQWPMRHAVRGVSVGIDVVLLSAGVGLWTLGGWSLSQSPWLLAKLMLLVGYILLGSWALKRARSARGRMLFGLAALTVAAQMVGIAFMHHPLGWGFWVMQR
jgi:uncharacterized membrane protein SirB2